MSGFLQISLCFKMLKKRSSHQGKKEVACIVSKPLVSCLWGCGQSVSPPKFNIQGVHIMYSIPEPLFRPSKQILNVLGSTLHYIWVIFGWPTIVFKRIIHFSKFPQFVESCYPRICKNIVKSLSPNSKLWPKDQIGTYTYIGCRQGTSLPMKSLEWYGRSPSLSLIGYRQGTSLPMKSLEWYGRSPSLSLIGYRQGTRSLPMKSIEWYGWSPSLSLIGCRQGTGLPMKSLEWYGRSPSLSLIGYTQRTSLPMKSIEWYGWSPSLSLIGYRQGTSLGVGYHFFLKFFNVVIFYNVHLSVQVGDTETIISTFVFHWWMSICVYFLFCLFLLLLSQQGNMWYMYTRGPHFPKYGD